MDNYCTWKLATKMALVLEGVYICVTGMDNDEGHNHTAIALTALCVESQCCVPLIDAQTAMEAW
jgi:hypothetical protein